MTYNILASVSAVLMCRVLYPAVNGSSGCTPCDAKSGVSLEMEIRIFLAGADCGNCALLCSALAVSMPPARTQRLSQSALTSARLVWALPVHFQLYVVDRCQECLKELAVNGTVGS